MNSELIPILKKHYIFSALQEDELNQLIQHSTLKTIKAHTLIFQKDEQADYFYLIIRGVVRIYFSTLDGREKTIRIFKDLESFAEPIIFMNQNTYPANSSTVIDTQLLAIPIHLFKDIIKRRPTFYNSFIVKMMHHILLLNTQLEMLSTMNTKDRILKYIEHQLPANWVRHGTYRLPMNKQELAEYLAMRPETLSRTLKTIEEEGTLIWRKDGVTLINWPPTTIE